MIEILTGIFVFITTEISKKLHIPTTYVVGVLVLLVSIIYTYVNQNNPELVASLIKYAGLSFATSQSLWLAYNKYKKLTEK